MSDDRRCPKRVPPPRTPDGWTVEQLRSHPTYRYFLEPYSQCELEVGHAGPHRDGGLIWHDPPLIEIAY